VKAIGVLTSGGDAPGMNANLRAVVRAGLARGLRVVGIERGYQGLIDGHLRELTSRDVSGIINRGGTILRTARCEAFMSPEGRTAAAARLREWGLEGLVVCGGDGSFTGALKLHEEHGVAIAGTPGTIDNDLAGTDHTIGFSTAVSSAVEACDKIRDTADSHDRIFVVEVMGRRAGFIALETAIGAGAEVVLLPEAPERGIDDCVQRLQAARQRGKTSMLVICAEGAMPGADAAKAIGEGLPGSKPRVTVLGHVLRGGSPTPDDRLLATWTGADAVAALCEGDTCHHIGVVANQLVRTPLEQVLSSRKPIDPQLLALIDVAAL